MAINKTIARITALFATLFIILSEAAVPVPASAKAKKASIDREYRTIRLKYNSHIDSRYLASGFEGLQSMIKNRKKKATYTAVISNRKVAKTVKRPNKSYIDKTLIISTGTGTTKAVIYEKLSGKKKTKIGTIKIKVSKTSMAKVVDDLLFWHGKGIESVWLKLNLKDRHKVCDYPLLLQNKVLNNSSVKVHFKESEYSASYSLFNERDEEGEPIEIETSEIVDMADGVLTAKKAGATNMLCALSFSDGSSLDPFGIEVKVTDTVLKKEGVHNINNIRDSVVGLDTPVELADGTTKPLINFDNAATTPVLREVQNEVNEKMEMYGSIGRGSSQKSNYSTQIYNDTRDKVIDFLGADPEFYTCFYVNSTTDGLNKLASALITSKKDMVLATRIEHHANDLSWRQRCKVKYAEVDKDGRIDYSKIKALLKKYKGQIKYVTVTAASNVTGYVTDVHRVAKLAHKYGAKIIVDGAQIVAHRKFSMIGETDEENIDFFVFSAHKMYSPYGGGAVVGLSSVLNKHMPTFYGGGTIKIVGDSWETYKEAPARYEAGSPNYPGVVGLGKAIEILYDIGFDDIEAHEKVLNSKLIEGLKAQDDNMIIYGDSENIDDRVGVVTFNLPDVNSLLIADQLSGIGAVATRRGAFCAHPYVWRLMGIPDSQLHHYENCADANTPGMIRISFGIYNTEEEVDEFLDILPEALAAAREEQKDADATPEF